LVLSKVPQHSVDILRLESTFVQDENGDKVLLKSCFSKESATVIIFIRHFACIACRAHVAQMMDIKKDFEKIDCKLIFIGHGSAQALADFKTNMGLTGLEIYTDSTRESFLACAFKKGFKNLIQLKSASNMIKLALAGHKQTKYDPSQGIHRQMGGIVVISKKDKVAYHYISEAVGDFPDEEKILEDISNKPKNYTVED